jgi:ligand-binding SRPBCC domain-containing protein
MRQHFQTEQYLPYPVPQVFAFFADPNNLPRLMPAWQKARIDSATLMAPPPPPQPFPGSEIICAGSGSRMTLTIRPFPLSPIRLPWDALIEDFHWLKGFCDVQTRGPFRYWRHCHSVCPSGEGTQLTDSVEYELPLGALGTMANWIFVRHQLAATFRYRQRRALDLLAQP